jgi:uncharacterized protein with HEPN domain
MLSSRARQALFDICDNLLLAQEFTVGFSLETFKADRRTFYAVTRCLEIVSEAARHLPQVLRDRHPDLPWRAIMSVGNVHRHEYDNVVEEIVWRTVQQSLTPLCEAVEHELVGEP